MYYMVLYEDYLPDLYNDQTELYTTIFRDDVIEEVSPFVDIEYTGDERIQITKEEYNLFRANPWIFQLY